MLSKAVNVLAERSDVLAQRLAPPPEKAKCEWRTAVLAILHPCVPNIPDPLLPHHVANPEVACDIYTLLLLIKNSDLDQWLTHLTLPGPMALAWRMFISEKYITADMRSADRSFSEEHLNKAMRILMRLAATLSTYPRSGTPHDFLNLHCDMLQDHEVTLHPERFFSKHVDRIRALDSISDDPPEDEDRRRKPFQGKGRGGRNGDGRGASRGGRGRGRGGQGANDAPPGEV